MGKREQGVGCCRAKGECAHLPAVGLKLNVKETVMADREGGGDGKRGGRQASPTGDQGELRSEGRQGKEGNIAISTHTQK